MQQARLSLSSPVPGRSGAARAWLAAGLAAWLVAAAPAVRADAVVDIAGQTVQQPSFATLSGVPGAGSLSASADRRDASLLVQVAGGVPGFFTCCRVGSSAGIDSNYTVNGLSAAGQMVTFTWEATGTLTWSTENASVAESFNVGIFNKVGALYIHNVGWGTSFVDGPVFMGDFAGSATGPVKDNGHAGPEGVFDQTVPAAEWGGNGTVRFQTHWMLGDGWGGSLSVGTGISLVGDADAHLALRLVSATVAGPVGPAELLLDNGVAIPITAVPEPASLWMLLGGLGLVALWAGRRSWGTGTAG
jgi:PEP-CTERM motif